MRPLRLEMEGFGTFRDRTEVDFDGLELAAFVGPTGSGKSTVIDALTFALYGSVPRYDNPSLVAPVVHQLAVEAKVRLDFELAGRRYQAVRVVRRATSAARAGAVPRATTREARLEEVAEDGTTRVLAGNVTELDTEVRRLIGLDFTQFTRTIVLPQGEFARFIRAKAADRQTLLSQLLDLQLYSQLGVAARDRARDAAQQAGARRDRLDRLAHATDEAVAEAETQVGALDALAGHTATALSEIQATEDRLVTLRQRCEVLDRALGALAAVHVPADLHAFDQRLTAAREAQAAAAHRRDESWAALEAAREAAEAVGDGARYEAARRSYNRLAELGAAVVALTAELDTAREVEQAAHTMFEAQQAAARLTNDDLRAARLGADAAIWITQLVPGQACPVCAQTVAVVPHHAGDEVLVAAEQLAREAEQSLAVASRAAARAEGRTQSLEADRDQRQKEADGLAAALAGGPPPAELAGLVAQAAEAATHVRQTEQAWREQEKAVRTAEAELGQAGRAEDTWRASFTGQRDAVAEFGPPAPTGPTLADHWTALHQWATDRHEALSLERAEVATTGRELADTKAALVADLTAVVGRFGLDAPWSSLPVAIAERTAAERARWQRLVEERAEHETLVGELAELDLDRLVHDSLGQHLAANRFEGWLLSEALDDIVARANGRLAELSHGRYSLEVVEREFAVRDHGHADERRDVRTLSGGEIFLASLALALALAASIAELAPIDSPRLESIFLDEGFGTLDADTLDVLASTIEELSADGRLVVIVTHVRDLAERMPVRFEVAKGPTTSTIERVEA